MGLSLGLKKRGSVSPRCRRTGSCQSRVTYRTIIELRHTIIIPCTWRYVEYFINDVGLRALSWKKKVVEVTSCLLCRQRGWVNAGSCLASGRLRVESALPTHRSIGRPKSSTRSMSMSQVDVPCRCSMSHAHVSCTCPL